MKRVHIDSFESGLSRKDHGNSDAVLNKVRRSGAFSAFEMTPKLSATLDGLVRAGKIKEVAPDYPWVRFRLVEREGAAE